MKLVQRLWNDEAGFVVSAELVLIATVLVIGMLVGLVTIRDQVVQELADVADAISEVDQSYSFSGVTGHSASTSGTLFNDTHDFCEAAAGNDQSPGSEPQCVEFTVAPTTEDT
jgi:Flp pilus assembly pilin Flp